MTGSAKANVKLHSTITEKHPDTWEIADMSHIKNVSLMQTHFLMNCPCGWRGWVHKDLLTTPL
jgi:hypothetical protein